MHVHCACIRRYADPKKGCLTKGDLAMAMKDYSEVRCAEIAEHELPGITEAFERAQGHNQFVGLLSHARQMSKQTELELYRAQAAGAISASDIDAAFKILDIDGDGMVRKSEFVRRATDVFFSIQLGRVSNWETFQHAAASIGAEASSGRHSIAN